MQLCSRKEYCRKEIFDKILSWGCTREDANEIVDYLVEGKFLDERRYTEAFVRDKLRFNKWGRMKISYMLRAKNVEKSLAMDVLSEIDETEYGEILIAELQKKHRTGLRGNDYEVKGKLFRFATSRGFEPEIVTDAISKLTNS